jgi:SWI/SNF related-matrix-associated actin-dependent regulator of chromatin subfamily C
VQVDASARPSNVGPPFTGHFKIIADTPRGLQAWNPATDSFVTKGLHHPDTERKASITPGATKSARNIEIGRNVYEAHGKEIAAAAIKPGDKLAVTADGSSPNGATDTSARSLDDAMKAPVPKVHCYTCGVDCTRVYYHNPKVTKDSPKDASSKPRFNLCPTCFTERRLPGNQDTSSYLRMDNQNYTGSTEPDMPWSDEELLLLLEGLEKFDDSWADIAKHEGTRTREECVVKFLQLEIEDKYLDSEVTNGVSSLGLGGAGSNTLPFTQAENPVMSVIGFLAGLSEPSVTAAAAGRSVEELKRAMRKQLHNTSASEESKATGPNDKMDLDVRQETTTTTTTTTTTSMSALATIPLAATAARSAALASHEEREMTRLVSAVVNTTLQKLDLKLKQFDEIDSILQAERRELEAGRQQLFLDRLQFKKRVRDVQEGLRIAAATGGDQGIHMAQDVMSGGQRLAFQASMPGPGEVEPLSATGNVKSFEV